MTPQTLRDVLAARRDGRPIVLATRLSDGQQTILPDLGAPPDLQEAASAAMRRDQSVLVDLAGEAWFLHVHLPPWRLLVVGAVHIAQALLPLAVSLGYEVTLIDPRGPFNSAERFGSFRRVLDWPGEAIGAQAPDERTAVVTLTHDPKLDDPALDRALRSDAFFIGALGSRRTHAARLERLASLGHDSQTLARVRGPVGLPLGSVSASEIALSIVAEIVAVRRGSSLARRG